MNQSFYTDPQQTTAAFNERRRRYREMYHWGQVNLPTLVQQQVAAAQAAAEMAEAPQIIEGQFFTADSAPAGRYNEGLEHIRQLREEVKKSDPRNNKLLMALLMTGCGFANPWLAVDLLALAGVLTYRRMVIAAHASCPRCREPFGDARPWPLSVGGSCCQYCGLSLWAD